MISIGVNPPKTPVTEGSMDVAPASLPNICKMPGPPAPFVPAPLPNLGRSGDRLTKCTKKVLFEGNKVAIKGSYYMSIGDIASKGTGGGIISATTHGKTKFVAPGSMNVKAEGKNIQLLGDAMTNNGNQNNTGTMANQQPPVLAGTTREHLQKLANECNKKVNKEEACPPRPEGRQCTTLGTKKHKCCENAIKEDNKKREAEGKPSPLRSEVRYEEKAKSAAARKKADEVYETYITEWKNKMPTMQGEHAYKEARSSARKNKVWFRTFIEHGGRKGGFRADVVVVDPPDAEPTKNNVKEAYDFKFNCDEEGSMDQEQRDNYDKFLGKNKLQPLIHSPGNKC
ncbi:MAG: DUF4150 domain-containing protein [Desulfobacteraceae bacterium]|nr:DUF4150 domain-containing protein [Desulfobacteraceae bacterium]